MVSNAVEYGNRASWWIEYPNGLIDISRSSHLNGETPLAKDSSQLELPVDGNRVIRLCKTQTAFVIVDMQNYFLHPEIRDHPTGLACVEPILSILPTLRSQGIKILWVNWGLTDHELSTIPPSLARGFAKNGTGGFGSVISSKFGRLLMRGEVNSALYGPLHAEAEIGQKAGTDVWVNKNRISGLWGPQSALDLYLQENGITTLLFAGVNADQCVQGTLVDAYFRGYDCILVKDTTATNSPKGGYENVVYNSNYTYGFATDSKNVLEAK